MLKIVLKDILISSHFISFSSIMQLLGPNLNFRIQLSSKHNCSNIHKNVYIYIYSYNLVLTIWYHIILLNQNKQDKLFFQFPSLYKQDLNNITFVAIDMCHIKKWYLDLLPTIHVSYWIRVFAVGLALSSNIGNC